MVKKIQMAIKAFLRQIAIDYPWLENVCVDQGVQPETVYVDNVPLKREDIVQAFRPSLHLEEVTKEDAARANPKAAVDERRRR